MRKKDEPYKGMKEKYINITLLGRRKRKEQNITGGIHREKDTGYSVQICGITATEQKNHGSLQKRTGQQCS